jgi:hypothetical protein
VLYDLFEAFIFGNADSPENEVLGINATKCEAIFLLDGALEGGNRFFSSDFNFEYPARTITPHIAGKAEGRRRAGSCDSQNTRE